MAMTIAIDEPPLRWSRLVDCDRAWPSRRVAARVESPALCLCVSVAKSRQPLRVFASL